MKEILLVVIGISGGLMVGGALAAFITLLNLMGRLVQLSGSKKHIKLYEWTFSIGAVIFVIIYFSDFNLGLPGLMTAVVGLTAGTFVGLFSSALAEVLNVMPLISKKMKVKKELKYIIFSLMLGKVVGSLYFWILY